MQTLSDEFFKIIMNLAALKL